jgi:predicted nicotinamide N-methyase
MWAQGSLKKGRFSKAALASSTVLELGSGTGLAGMAAAMMGGLVTLTDVADVLPLLRENVALNYSTSTWAQHVALRAQFGTIDVCELDWTKPMQLSKFSPVQFILAADCVYHETLLQDLLRVILHCSDTKTSSMPSFPEPDMMAKLGLM